LTQKHFSEKGYFYQMGNPPLRLDIMMSVPGVEFEDSWNNRIETDIDGLTVPFISRQDLLKAKEASGRAQDIIDAENLKKSE